MKRDEGLPTILYLVVFCHQRSGMNQKVISSIANLMNFVETEDAYVNQGLSKPDGYDVYYVDLETLEVGVYDPGDLRRLMRLPKGRKGASIHR